MKTTFKTIIASAVGASMLGISACTDLDETTYDVIAAEDYEFTDADRAAMFYPVYNSLRDFIWGWFGFTDLADMASDLWCVPYRIGIGWGDLYVPTHKHTFHSQIGFFSTAWSRAYAGVNSCNKLLNDESIASSESAVAELRGYRALYYYFLFDLFRNIPLDKGELHDAGWLPEQATPQETFDYIVSELKAIEGAFGDQKELGRMNNATINMLLAKMYLNHNAWLGGDDESYYKLCIDELNKIIAMGYQLSPNYKDNFRESIAASPEVIFGIPYEEKYAGGNYYANLWMCNAGRATWGFNGWATSGGGAHPQFIETYDADDQRYVDCWISGPQYDKDGLPIYIDGIQLNYTHELRSIDNPGCYEQEGERLVKYEILGGDKGTSYDDQVIFRYADVLLMKAECLLRISGAYNGEGEALAAELVTQVRQRNFKTAPGKALRTVAQLRGGSCYDYGHRENRAEIDQPDNWIITHEGGDDIILGGLLDELAWEFVAEGHRRQDLVRFMMTNGCNVWNGKSWFCKDGMSDPNDRHYDVFPIPKDAMEGNPKLVQNPGYAS